MLSIPLPFIVGLVFALTLYRNLKGVETPGSKRYFTVFLIAYALQGIIIGLRFGYGVEWLHLVQPATAAAMPPLAYLAFRSLAAIRSEKPWLHVLPFLAVALAVAFFPFLTDLLLMTTFIAYGVLLYRFTYDHPDAVAETPLPRMLPALRAARLCAVLLLFFGLTDAGLAAFTFVYGNEAVPAVVTAMNIAVLVTVAIYGLAPQIFGREPPAAEPEQTVPSADDQALLIRIQEALDAKDLYRQEDLSLAKLARRVGAPARDVSAAINRATGLNVSQFVNNRRIREVCRLLEETDQPLTTIMLDAGFATKSNFNREFRRVTGMSPSEWRSKLRASLISKT
ncbi:helix-turn-helix domain-containing protein [Rhizobium rhizoryzae]|uniref:helix-turn-helix domain-containing protein n=1 Tax=Rhizobium rhizoryzae TaxID=451876 RepID=UPI0028A0D335|nr:AraC family transcriptional regulator [Rhizobium rhizoryzae]